MPLKYANERTWILGILMDIIATLPFVASRSNLPEQTSSKPSIYAEDTKKTFLISSSSKDKDTKSPTVNPGSKLLWDPESNQSGHMSGLPTLPLLEELS